MGGHTGLGRPTGNNEKGWADPNRRSSITPKACRRLPNLVYFVERCTFASLLRDLIGPGKANI